MTLSIIGAGYGRTGTTSLQLALEHLGFGPCYKWAEATLSPSLWLDAFSHKSINWEEVFRSYKSAVDFPTCLFYRELMVKFPCSKIILTIRDGDAWFNSTQETYLAPKILANLRLLPTWQLYEKNLFTAFRDQLHDRAAVIACYEQHNIEVQRSVPADRLLVYKVHQGWSPLCRFLGVPIPKIPFPNLNRREEWVEPPTFAGNDGGDVVG